MTATRWTEWIGRSAESTDRLTPGPVDRLAATLDRDDAPARDGDPLPPLGHWLFFLPDAPQSALGPDGHPARGGFLPPIHELPRRMWAGSRIAFSGTPRLGEPAIRRSEITDVREKAGGAGPLLFVTVRHEIGHPGEPVAIVDEHDIVYRGIGGAAAKPPEDAGPAGRWQRRLVPDPVLLFRYSALTFNGHRIHYDRAYATEIEAYPGLVVHGPLIATLLLDHLRRRLPEARIARFAFRAVSPLFDGSGLILLAEPPDAAGHVRLWATDAANGLRMRAEATVGTGAEG